MSLSDFEPYIKEVLENYGLSFAILFLGFISGWKLKYYLADKKYINQLHIRLQERDERLSEFSVIISDRLKKVKVNKESQGFFRKIKKFFANHIK